MRLLDLNPRFIGHGGEGVSDQAGNPIPRREAVGLICDCPKCGPDHRMFVPFANPPDGGPSLNPAGHNWQRTGEEFATMSLTPSILRKDCGWHGFITNGEVLTV